MAKTGWKASQTWNKQNRLLHHSNASSKVSVGRRQESKKNSSSQRRTVETIQRLKMYSSGKPIRNKKGHVVAGTFMMNNRAGDRPIDPGTGRIPPDRRWFGNTRTVASNQLDSFRQEMTEAVADPYSVVLKRKKLPMGLLQEVAEYSAKGNQSKTAVLEQEPYEKTFGKQSMRKRVKLDQLLQVRSLDKDSTSTDVRLGEGQADVVERPTIVPDRPMDKDINNNEHDKVRLKDESADASAGDDDDDVEEDDDGADDNVKMDRESKMDDFAGYHALLATAQQSLSTYQTCNNAEGIVPWGRDSHLAKPEGEDVDWRYARKDDLFLKGQSKRIWGEFFKVIDCSDVVLHIIDARNVPGTRCTMIERHITKNASHKHLVFVLNKIDLVPNWVAKRWMGELARDRPTIAFHASMNHAFGKGALISLLRQFGKLHQDKKQISVGVVGYPNVGKSSVINTLISKKSCRVAPIPGETKIWQYVNLFKRIALIDCPGVVVDTAGDTEVDSVLKGVVRAERLENPEAFVDSIQECVKREHIAGQYKLTDMNWSDSEDLLERIARKFGRLRKGGDPCLRSAAIMLIQDFQRGRLPHYVAPPELKEDAPSKAVSQSSAFPGIDQNLDQIGEENMKHVDTEVMDAMETKTSENNGRQEVAGETDDVKSISGTAKRERDEKTLSPKKSSRYSKGPVTASELLAGAGDWED